MKIEQQKLKSVERHLVNRLGQNTTRNDLNNLNAKKIVDQNFVKDNLIFSNLNNDHNEN